MELGAGIKATHGYPPESMEMGTVFYAWGTGIRRGQELPSFNIIDATPSALNVLKLRPHPSASGQVRDDLFVK